MKIFYNYKLIRHTEQGYSLLDVLLSTVIMSYGMVQIANLTSSSSNEAKQLNAANHIQRVVSALNEYAQQQNVPLISALNSASNVIVDVNSLISGSYLPPGFNPINIYGNTVMGQFISAGSYGVIGLAYTSGGTALSSVQAAELANKLGAKGGWVQSVSTISSVNGKSTTVYKSYLKGAGNAWGLDLNSSPYTKFTNLQSNQVVAYLNMDTGMGSPADNDFVRRHPVSGQPELNTMATSLKLFNASSVVSGATDVIGLSCSQYGLHSIATNATGEVISCQQLGSTLLWQPAVKSYWKPPVASFASLPTTACSAASGFCAHANNIGDMRLETTNFNTYTWTGSVWKPLVIDNAGNLAVSGALTVSSNAVFNGPSITIDGQLNFTQNPGIINAVSGLNLNGPNFILPNGWLITSGLKVTYGATINGPCDPIQRMFAKNNASGEWMICAVNPAAITGQWQGFWKNAAYQ